MEVPGSYLSTEARRQGRGFYGFPQSFQINSRIFPYAIKFLGHYHSIIRRHTFHRH